VNATSLSEVFACPACLGGLAAETDGPRCEACGAQYRWTAAGRPDFRLAGPRTLRLDYAYDPAERFSWDRVTLKWPQRPLPFEVPAEWEAAEISLTQSIPSARPGARSLDVGCGGEHQRFREPLSKLGYTPLGVDISGEAPDVLADAHLLPFGTASFDLLVTSAVFEHLKQPHIAMAESARVAKPGTLFVGSIAFGEPYHISYFHHSPLAVFELLWSAGFRCRTLIVSNKWCAFCAHLAMGFAGARYPDWLRDAIPRLLLRATQVHSAIKWAFGRGTEPLRQDLFSFARSHSAAVGFIAERAPRDTESRLRRPAL
jgi:SAM-dependent methyltransferase